MSIIEAMNVSKSFGEVEAVKDITLRISEGEFFGLFGPNGAGKTTLFRMLTGQLEPDSGEINTARAHQGVELLRKIHFNPIP